MTVGNRVQVPLMVMAHTPVCGKDLRSVRRSITVQLSYGYRGRVAERARNPSRPRDSGSERVVLYDAFGRLDMPRERVEFLRKSGIEPFRPLRISAMHLTQNLPMPGESASTAELDERAVSASMTNGLGTAAGTAPGTKPTCVSKVPASSSGKPPSSRRGRRRPARSSPDARL